MYVKARNTYEHMQHFILDMKTTMYNYFISHHYERDYVTFTHVGS